MVSLTSLTTAGTTSAVSSDLAAAFVFLLDIFSIIYLAGYVREKAHESSALHGCGQLALVLGGDARTLPGDETAVRVDELAQDLRIFVIDLVEIMLAEITLFVHVG